MSNTLDNWYNIVHRVSMCIHLYISNLCDGATYIFQQVGRDLVLVQVLVREVARCTHTHTPSHQHGLAPYVIHTPLPPTPAFRLPLRPSPSPLRGPLPPASPPPSPSMEIKNVSQHGKGKADVPCRMWHAWNSCGVRRSRMR